MTKTKPNAEVERLRDQLALAEANMLSFKSGHQNALEVIGDLNSKLNDSHEATNIAQRKYEALSEEASDLRYKFKAEQERTVDLERRLAICMRDIAIRDGTIDGLKAAIEIYAQGGH